MTKPLGALVVDDERLARQELKSLLAAHPEVRVLGEAASVDEARAKVEELSPDVVFLDIQMPGGSGFDLVESMPGALRVVFVTAYSEFALRAFEVNALDYLLKPVNARRLAETVERISRGNGTAAPAARRDLDLDDPLIFPTSGNYQVVRVKQISCIKAARDYSEVTTMDGRTRLVSRSLKEWEETLPERHFLRVHRSTIVNVDQVEKIEPWFHSAFRITLKGLGEPVEVSRRFATLLRERLV